MEPSTGMARNSKAFYFYQIQLSIDLVFESVRHSDAMHRWAADRLREMHSGPEDDPPDEYIETYAATLAVEETKRLGFRVVELITKAVVALNPERLMTPEKVSKLGFLSTFIRLAERDGALLESVINQSVWQNFGDLCTEVLKRPPPDVSLADMRELYSAVQHLLRK
jgi:hypothetical protein